MPTPKNTTLVDTQATYTVIYLDVSHINGIPLYSVIYDDNRILDIGW